MPFKIFMRATVPTLATIPTIKNFVGTLINSDFSFCNYSIWQKKSCGAWSEGIRRDNLSSLLTKTSNWFSEFSGIQLNSINFKVVA